MIANTQKYDDGKTAIVFMGHGTEAESNAVYAQMQEVLTGKGMENYYVGTVEAEPSLEDVMAAMDGKGYTDVVLEDMMVVCGDHANNDMAGDEEDSWKSILTAAGYNVKAVMEGLGQHYAVEQIYAEHTQAAMDSIGATVDKSVAVDTTPAVDSDKAILVVSFGTSFDNSRSITIGGIENALREAYPDYQIRRAFTAQIIIDRLAEEQGIVIDDVETAINRAAEDGIKELIIQPTHLMAGLEYEDLAEIVEANAGKFDKIALSANLLDTDEDFTKVAETIVAKTAAYDDGETAIVFMGHGTEAESNAVYQKMQDTLTAMGAANYYVGTVEASPSLDDVLAAIEGKGYTKVVLEDLMVVCGDHANNDMAGEDEDSWVSLFKADGAFSEIDAQIEGLGGIPAVQQVYVSHSAEFAK